MAPIAGGEDVVRARIGAAALTCVARWGFAKTLEDVAREAGCGRATIYRSFQGGKAEVMSAVVAAESLRFRVAVDDAVAAAGDDLEDVVVAGVVAAARFLDGHDALRYLLAHEPDAVLPWVTFHRLGALFAVAGRYADPHLARFLPDADHRARAVEWLARVVLTYVLNPADGVDLTDEADARRLLRTFVLPGITPRTQEPSHVLHQR
jgi:AcrR family transcriptional regulator